VSSTPTTRQALRPLRALRYDPAKVELADVVAPPYDVISASEREVLRRRSDYSVVNLILPDSPRRAADLLHAWRREGVLARDAEPAVWWHRQRFVGPDGVERTRSGFLSDVRLSPYDEGRIRPHEQTHSRVKSDLLELLRATRTTLSPIFGFYDDPKDNARRALAPRTSEPPAMLVTDSDGTEHAFWPVTAESAVAAVQETLAEREILIADGHHRYETALAYHDEPGGQAADHILMYLANVHGDGLAVYPTHRVVMGRREVTPDLLAAFDVRELDATPAQLEAALSELPADRVAFAVWRGPQRPPLLCMLRDRGAVLMAMSGSPAALRKVDAAVLEAIILAPMLGLLHAPEQFLETEDVRYVRDLGAACALVDSGESAAAFILRAPPLEQVMDVARAGALMPQKSTYFFPKLWSGFLLDPHEDA
jgi:uncharacterized protein (DUF1015 family)